MHTLTNGKQDSRAFLAGLLDWVGNRAPSFESIAGRRTIEQGAAHIKSILHTGGEILGHRDLALDGIEPDLTLSQSPGPGCYLQRGFEILRPATPHEERELQVFSTWGYKVIEGLAQHYFGKP